MSAAILADPEKAMLPPGGPWSPAYRRTTVGLLLTVACSAFEALAVATILPDTVDDLGGLGYYGWAFSAFMLANMVGLIVSGDEADRRGPAAPLIAGMSLFAVGLVVGGSAPSMPVLILARAVQGFGGGLISSVAYVAMGRGYPDAARPKMLALLSTAWVVPGLIGPAIAGFVSHQIGWRWVFFGILPLLVVAIALALPAMRRIPGGVNAARDWPRLRAAVLIAGGMALLLAGLGMSTVWLAIPLALAGALIAWRWLPRVLPSGTLLARAGLPAAVATMGLLNLAFFGVDAFVPLALTDLRGTSTGFAGLALTAATITWTAGAWLQAHYAKRIAPRVVIRLGLTILIVGVLLTIGVLVTDSPVLLGPLTFGLAGLGMGLAYSCLSLVVLDCAPAGQEGQATSSMQLAGAVGGALATGAGGVLIDLFSTGDVAARAGIVWQFLLMIAVFALAMATAARLPRRLTRAGDEAGGAASAEAAPVPSAEALVVAD